MKITDYISNKDSQMNIDLPEEFTLKSSKEFFNFINQDDSFENINSINVNFRNMDRYDTIIVVFINKLEKVCLQKSIEMKCINMKTDLVSYIKLLTFENPNDDKSVKSNWLVEHINFIGKNIQFLNKELFNFISFLGEVLIKFANMIFKPKDVRWKDFPFQFTNVGVYALPISAMIVFLIGLISGYQGSLQLKQFGADIYIADLVGVALTRTLSPLLVAILVAGRSGSAFAAELGTMKVSEEIDALKSMGFDILNFLVMPRILAVMLAMPILVLICDLVGIIGGLIAALSTLNITIYGFIIRSQVALHYGDIFSGLFKSIVYGFIIALVGCFKGLQAKGGADAVGRFTTSAVVTSIFLIILCDSIFTILFQTLGF